MEAFSLLKYWMGGGGGGAAASMRLSSSSTTTTTTITTTVPQETDESDDEGPFFDLEFTLPVEDDGFEGGGSDDEQDLEADRDSTVSSSVGGGGPGAAAADPDLPFSPSENLFFKGGERMSLEPSPSTPLGDACETNSKRQFPVSLLRSATKFRVFLLGFKKAKPSSTEAASSPKRQQQQHHHSRFFTVKFKVEEVPIVSLFRRENSWRSCSCKRHLDDGAASEEDGISASEMKRLLKDVMHKYLKMLKPLNGRKDGGERHRFSGQLSQLSFGLGGKPSSRSRRNNSMSSSSSSSEDRVKKQQQRQGSLREVCRHLSKSRSVSSAAAGAVVTLSSSAAAAEPPPPPLQLQSQRRDDSLLQQQDGIQSAIAHCKRSFHAPQESEAVAVC